VVIKKRIGTASSAELCKKGWEEMALESDKSLKSGCAEES
jgi:hypothetical protein